MIGKQKKKKFSQNAAISGLKYAFEHRDGNPAAGREEMVSRRKGAEKCEWSDDEPSLLEAAEPTFKCMTPFCFLSPALTGGSPLVRKAFGALQETCSHPLLLCFYFLPQPTPGSICHKRLSNFPSVITPRRTVPGLHQSFQKSLFNHPPTISLFWRPF